ncbi:GAF domain-containing protein [Microvirga sesbaniae]|uniref:GAF domain-containing protein n=1 Tax=Microvirga sesbaniae TaxID=681392 RepID=UPI0021C68557|nr:GAF domain-containing protein [Microvirga sp. HBU67692]
MPPSPALERICRVAQKLLEIPIVLVTLVDAERVRFKAGLGLGDLAEPPREHAFCAYTILHDVAFVVPDAKVDRQFASYPYVDGGPQIRFYAGAPLITEPGIRLGSLCVLDTKPRQFTPDHTAMLRGLSRLVVDEIWLHHLEQSGRVDRDLASLPHEQPELAFMLDRPLTGAQVRAARALLNWSVRELAEASGVSPMTVKRIEAQGGDTVRRESLKAVEQALDRAGIGFRSSSDLRCGVGFRADRRVDRQVREPT